MNKYIYSVCIKGCTYPEVIIANSIEDAQKKVEYIYSTHIPNMHYNSYIEFIYLIYEICGISLSEIFNVNEL